MIRMPVSKHSGAAVPDGGPGMLHVAVVILVAMLAADPAFAFNEPDSFRGVPWGASEDDLQAKLGETLGRCKDYPAEHRWIGDRSCTVEFQLGGITVGTVYNFRANRFIGV